MRPAPQAPPRATPSSGRRLDLLTNYPHSGIGDFGQTLRRHLLDLRVEVHTEETDPEGRGSAEQFARVARGSGPLLVNVGLTAWGRSSTRNLSGFRAIGKRVRAGDRVVAIVHHTIEQFDSRETGYPVRPWTRRGAHYALARLAGCRSVAFSPGVEQTLRTAYGWPDVWLTALPNEEAVHPAASSAGPAQVVTAGYLAPYKGLDLFLSAAALRKGPEPWSIVGEPHRVLSADPTFLKRVTEWRTKADRAGVSMPGYQAAEALSRQWTERTIGVLCYTSSSGASASFSMFAERGVPVVATDLPEFRFLLERGAGVVLVEPEPQALVRAIETLSGDAARWEGLSRSQIAFSRRYSWRRFSETLIGLLLGPGEAGPGDPPTSMGNPSCPETSR